MAKTELENAWSIIEQLTENLKIALETLANASQQNDRLIKLVREADAILQLVLPHATPALRKRIGNVIPFPKH